MEGGKGMGLVAAGGRETQGDFKGVVDEPLEGLCREEGVSWVFYM